MSGLGLVLKSVGICSILLLGGCSIYSLPESEPVPVEKEPDYTPVKPPATPAQPEPAPTEPSTGRPVVETPPANSRLIDKFNHAPTFVTFLTEHGVDFIHTAHIVRIDRIDGDA